MFWLEEEIWFPHPENADEDGILAIGGDLSPERVLLAYQHGIFPWFNEEDPIVWWSPDPRFVLHPSELKVSKSMRKVLRDEIFTFTFDQDFRAVITACSQNKRLNQSGGTWITDDMLEAYCTLHELGFAHSVEVWQGDELVGGLYGVSLGKCFSGESMFTKVSNASKAGFITLVRKLEEKNFDLIDCQTHTNHLESLGGKYMDRADYLSYLEKNKADSTIRGNWGDWLL